MTYVSCAIVLLINVVLFWAIKDEGYTLALYLNLMNVLTLPMLYMIISNRAGLFYSAQESDAIGSLPSKVVSELLYVLKQPVVLILFVFPLLLGVILFQVDPQDYLSFGGISFIQLLLGLNLLIISILIKLYFQNQYPFLITATGVPFVALVSLFGIESLYLFYFGIGLIVITSVLIIILVKVKPIDKEESSSI